MVFDLLSCADILFNNPDVRPSKSKFYLVLQNCFNTTFNICPTLCDKSVNFPKQLSIFHLLETKIFTLYIDVHIGLQDDIILAEIYFIGWVGSFFSLEKTRRRCKEKTKTFANQYILLYFI